MPVSRESGTWNPNFGRGRLIDPMHTGFTIEHPQSLGEAIEILASDDPKVRPLAGGTGLTVLMKYDFLRPSTLVSLGRIAPEMSSVAATGDGGFRLGAMATLRDLEQSKELVAAFPIIGQALNVLASIRVRNVAQLGGALAHAHPQMDLPPVLLALEARVLVRSRRGDRWIDADDLFVGYYETSLRNDELIIEVELPAPGPHRGLYRKFTERTADDWPMLGVAAVASVDSASSRRLRVSLGALGDRPIRLRQLESAFGDGSLTINSIRDVVGEVAGALEYRDGPFVSAAYQRQLVSVHLRRALEEVLAGEATEKDF